MTTQDQDTVGVLVARFQVPELHPGHHFLIRSVRTRHSHACAALGVRRGMRTAEDPLTYQEREVMVRQAYPDESLTIVPIYDHPISPDRWSATLDQLIENTFPGRTAILYGSRGSFLQLYTGHFPVVELEEFPSESGTSLREKQEFPHTPDARAAIIYAERTRHAIAYSTVDLAILHPRKRKVLLIGKEGHDEFLSFPGGFFDPEQDTCDLEAVLRERSEEIKGIRITNPVAVGDQVVNDPRYRRTKDAVKTRFFSAYYNGGTPVPGDDAASVHWIDYGDLENPSIIAPWHLPLGALLREHIERTERSYKKV